MWSYLNLLRLFINLHCNLQNQILVFITEQKKTETKIPTARDRCYLGD